MFVVVMRETPFGEFSESQYFLPVLSELLMHILNVFQTHYFALLAMEGCDCRELTDKKDQLEEAYRALLGSRAIDEPASSLLQNSPRRNKPNAKLPEKTPPPNTNPFHSIHPDLPSENLQELLSCQNIDSSSVPSI